MITRLGLAATPIAVNDGRKGNRTALAHEVWMLPKATPHFTLYDATGRTKPATIFFSITY